MSMTHLSVEPAILYLGTPVVLVSSINEDGSPNLAPMSSAFWLGWRGMLGFEAVSKTPANIVRTGECVLNLPSMDQVDAINRLSRLTGSNPIPAGKALRGYRYHADKFGIAGLTPVASETVAPPRVLECPIQLEAELVRVIRDVLSRGDLVMRRDLEEFESNLAAFVGTRHAVGVSNCTDGLRLVAHALDVGPGDVVASKLAQIPEEQYRTPDIDRANVERLRNANRDRAAAD